MPGSGYSYLRSNPNIYSNAVAEIVEYHINTLPILQYIIGDSGPKGKYGCWLIVWMNKGEHPVLCMGQYEAIFKQYIS